MSYNRRCALLSLATLGVLVHASMAMAGSLTPNPASGNPSTVGPNGGFNVSLIPDPANYRSPAVGCPWLLPAAQSVTEPYNNTANNIWKFAYAPTFNGTFKETTYAATNDGTDGGADFTLTYTPGMGDPSGANVRWMQVIDTNAPGGLGTSYGVKTAGAIPSGTTAYMDNAGPRPTETPIDPYYGWLSVPAGGNLTQSEFANSTSFTDSPNRALRNGLIWEAQVFVTSETDTVAGATTTHNVTIYGGVWWGFTETAVGAPEPGSVTLLASGFGFFTLRRKRERLLS